MSAPQGALDRATVRSFVATIHEAAARALKGAPDPGMLQLDVLHPAGTTMQSSRYPIGAIDLMADAAISAAENGLNVYVEGRTVDARASGRGKAGGTRGVFAFVDDADFDKGKGGSLTAEPSLVVETSPGNRHSWLFLDQALTAEQADPIGRAMRKAAGSDSASAKLTQPYRVAGTPNYPDAKKLARGRTVAPTRILASGGPVWTAEALAKAFPPTPEAATGTTPGGRSGKTSDTVEALAAERGEDRSAQFFRVVLTAVRVGLLPDDLEEVFRRHPGGCGGKYLAPTDRLVDEIARAWPKSKVKVDVEVARPAVDPTYPDHAVSVTDARSAVREAIAAHLSAGEGYRAIRVATGVGKTRIAAEMIAGDVRRRRALSTRRIARKKRAFLYAVPRHKLGDEVAALFEANGVTARVYRGRSAEDPRRPGSTMCDDLPAVELALKLGEAVGTSCCKGENPKTGTKVTCPFFHSCGYQQQKLDPPDAWIVAHQLLFQAQAALGGVAGVVIDEGFWQAGLWSWPKGLTLDQVGAGPDLQGRRQDDAVADVAAYREQLARALRRQAGLGGVERRHLAAEGLDPSICTLAIEAEWKLKGAAAIWPGMPAEARRKAKQTAQGARHVRKFVALWKAARELLHLDEVGAVSGRMFLANTDTEEGVTRVVRVRGLKPITKQWASRPTLIMDATLPGLPILRQFYPDMEIVADVEAEMPFARVRQAIGAPVSAGKLLRSEADRNLWSVRRAILHRFLEVSRQSTLVVAQMKVAEWLKASGLPDGIEIAHFNAIAGLDRFKDVRLLIAIGRTLPFVLEVEDMAGALTGLEAAKTVAPAKGVRWYDKATLGIRMVGGSGYAVDGDRHPDETAEAIRFQICEGELVQAIGRARGVNRSAANPVDIEIWSDVVLPVTVDEVTPWDQVTVGAHVEMLVDGIVLDSPSDMAVCWPKVWETPEAARRWQSRTTSGQNPIGDTLYKDLPACGLRYRHRGERQKWRIGRYDPAVLPDPRAWLESRLGELVDFEMETTDAG